ncbi:hypothetical protein M501DRAFT_937617 [Patellaria atrata CBS 101060]|uniref:BTB domain-containing protein n=1 Tax=Patellaria atrata CBS 101060 TaxID=1346257 RepID=A0A9P4S7C2_9PEZI|nr:hypothetical protein M501DRAFT_937617 [Patellaria atrata CBS 101060]
MRQSLRSFSASNSTTTSSSCPLTTHSSATSPRSSPFENISETDGSVSRRSNRIHSIQRAEKDVDDPNTPRNTLFAQDYLTSRTINGLFSHTSPSPGNSRSPSNFLFKPLTMRHLNSGTATLPEHLYTKGLLSGRHSDVTITAFGNSYPLHRLILDRAPFFSNALSGPWLESTAKEVTLHPEAIDSNITPTSFELALKRLYGCDITAEEDEHAIGLFATGCWLEMQDLIESSIDAILRLMSPAMLSSLIKLVTSNYYGQAGERILASAKAMLCRDGWEMHLRFWDGIPGDIIREIVGGDGFYIDGEWDRWILAKRLLDRRLKYAAVDAGLLEPGTKIKIQAPDTLTLMAIRFDSVYRKNAITTGRQTPDSHERWLALYTNVDIEPLLVLLDEGIHYVHLSFEQLQYIKQARDIFGLPMLPEKVISDALWMNMELRQKVIMAHESNLELGLSSQIEEPALINSPENIKVSGVQTDVTSKGKGKAMDLREDGEMESGSWDANGKPRKFWIPSADCNIVMGGNSEPIVTTSNSCQRTSRNLTNLQPEDLQWGADFTNSSATDLTKQTASNPRPGSSGGIQPKPVAYTHYPPFRFAAEFPSPRGLKEKKRVYSRTVFYAGSLWNIYIQKVRSAKNPQLGVYLHRAKERDTDEVLGPSGLAQSSMGTVDERIGLLEREMLLRSERRDRRRGRGNIQTVIQSNALNPGSDTSGSGNDHDHDPDNSPINPHQSGRLAFARYHRNSIELADFPDSESDFPSSDSDEDSRASIPPALRDPPSPLQATLPPYVDARPTIKTYFKIYSPSKGGRLLSIYESAPDRFNFSQSWGWKSSTLMLDEGLTAEVEEGEGVEGEGGSERRKKGRRGAGRLRFMVVIGNL